MKRSTECENIEELLPLYIEGDLSTDEAASVTAHLAGCEMCVQSLETYRQLETSLQGLPAIVPDPRLVSSKVTGSLGLEKRSSIAGIFWRMSLVWTVSVTTAAILLLVSRFDFVSALMSGQESLIDSAGRTMEYWIASSSGVIAGFFNEIEGLLAADPWVFMMGMIGFGLVIFTAGIVAALKTMR